MEKEKRQAPSLTLAGDRKRAEAFILQALSARRSGNSSGRLPEQLPEGSPGMLPAHARELGRALDIKKVAKLIGCSPWTVRQKLLRRGLPHFRSGASGKLIFYEAQVVRWIQKHQGG